MSKRHRYLVDSKVQWALIRRLLMHWSLALLSLITISVFVQLLYRSEGRTFAEAFVLSFRMQLPLLGIMFMLMPVFVWDMVKLSHRFAGPMLRLRGVINELAHGGEAAPIRFRPNDFWQETADDFNQFYGRYAELQQQVDSLHARCETLQHELESAKSPSA
ncbi:MAG: hypothetical protein AAGJ83_02075 [Planctomycetota bacterium]